ncbi:MAG: hypothetical protein AMXMBFR58_05690 [Phycisphaerae bacterium]
MKTVTNRRLCAALLAVCGMGAVATADLLSDAQLYFDPASIQPDFYSRLLLDDLASQHTITFDAGSNPVIGANILPMLRPGDYFPGYSYSQADYFHTPNSDYYADLTSGSLAASFMQPGLYHIRTYRADGQTDVFAVFAESGFKEKDGSPDRSGGEEVLDPVPDADLFIVEKSDSTIDDSAEVWTKFGKKVVRVADREAAVKAIETESNRLHRKIHVELDGHGAPANMSTGAGVKNIPSKQVDSTSVKDFCERIRKFCNYLTFQGCSVGQGTEGESFLQTIASAIGTAGAWDSEVTVIDKSGFSVSSSAKFVIKTPAPGAASLFALTTLFAVRRRRA